VGEKAETQLAFAQHYSTPRTQIYNSAIPTFLSHACLEALLEATVAALVSLVLIDDARATEAARVDVILADASTEKSLATVARSCTVMLARGTVVADSAAGRLRRAGRTRSGQCW